MEYRVFINDASGADECCGRAAKTCSVVHTDLSFCVNSGYFPSFVQIRAFHTSFCPYFFFPWHLQLLFETTELPVWLIARSLLTKLKEPKKKQQITLRAMTELKTFHPDVCLWNEGTFLWCYHTTSLKGWIVNDKWIIRFCFWDDRENILDEEFKTRCQCDIKCF